MGAGICVEDSAKSVGASWAFSPADVYESDVTPSNKMTKSNSAQAKNEQRLNAEDH